MFAVLAGSLQQTCLVNDFKMDCIFAACQADYGCMINETREACDKLCGRPCWYTWIPFELVVRSAQYDPTPRAMLSRAYFCPAPALIPTIAVVVTATVVIAIALSVFYARRHKKQLLEKKKRQECTPPKVSLDSYVEKQNSTTEIRI